MKNSVLRIACSIAVAAGVTGQASATDSRNFNVTFKKCIEFVGVTEVDRKKADALVPEQFTVQNVFRGQAAKPSIVVRVASCKSVRVDGGPSKPGMVAHIGINIESPDGTGTINNYTVSYASNSEELVAKLQEAGVPAELDRNMSFEFTRDGGPKGEDVLYASISTERSPHWVVHGVTNGPSPILPGPTPFLANWWRAGHGYATKMATDIKSISFKDASKVSFFTARSNVIGNLIGGNAVTTFTELPVRGVFDRGDMVVSVQH